MQEKLTTTYRNLAIHPIDLVANQVAEEKETGFERSDYPSFLSSVIFGQLEQSLFSTENVHTLCVVANVMVSRSWLT
jgi:hypothetical protein